MLLSALFLLTAFSRAAETATAVTANCPVAEEKFKDITDDQVEQWCFTAEKALAPVKHFGQRFAGIRQCRNSFAQVRESALVISAGNGRKKSFHPDIEGALGQKKSQEKIVELLLNAHSYANISLAALYRSRLKLREQTAAARRLLAELPQETADVTRDHDRTVEAEKNARAQGIQRADYIRDVVIPAFAREYPAIQETERSVSAVQDCAAKVQGGLDIAFEEWAKIKSALLEQKLTNFVDEDAPDAGPAKTKALGLQGYQQSVYDNLTDPAKRSGAYRLAEGCMESGCTTWLSIMNGAGSVAQTPVIADVARVLIATITFSTSSGQGLSNWQSLLETGNELTPLHIHLLDTEVSDMESGRVKPFTP